MIRSTPTSLSALTAGGEGGGGTSNEIVGDDGPNVLFGDPEGVPRDDVIRGLGGDDFLYGLFGNDVLVGGDDDDEMYGGDGDDDIWPFPGLDSIDGGAGRDMIRVNTDRMQFIVNLSARTVTIPIGAGIEVPGFTVVDVLDPATNTAAVVDMEGVRLGTANDDYFCGSDRSVVPSWTRNGLSGDGEFFGGGRGNDFISAGGGDDFIGADRGDDVVIGGPGDDVLHGAENGDAFVFYAADFTADENDIIDDFNIQADTIVLIGLTAGAPTQSAENGGKGKPDWEVPLFPAVGGGQVGTITTWDVNPSASIVVGNGADWPDYCRP